MAQVEAWLRREAESGGQKGKPQARVTCRDYKQMLGEMLEWAVARRYINWNPARIAKLPKDRSATNPDSPAVYKKSREKESFTPEQYAALVAALTASGDDAIKTPTPTAYFIASLSTGERPGEMDALRWPQVDFKNRTITVDRAIKRADGGRPLGIGPTKTGNRRDVEMTDVLAVALRTIASSRPSAAVLPARTGRWTRGGPTSCYRHRTDGVVKSHIAVLGSLAVK